MKLKFLKIFSVILVALLIPFSTVFAAGKITQDQTVVLSTDETVNGDYFATGEKVTVLGTVNGDAYIAGGNIFIEGTINGDLLAAGGTVNIIGNVSNDIRVAGGNVIISGEVGGNVTTLGGSVTYTDAANIGGSVVNGSGSLILLAPVAKGATIGSGDATFNSSIGGDVTAGVGNLNLNPKTNIFGNLTYWSSEEANILEGAEIQGETVRNEIEQPPQTPNAQNFFGAASTGLRVISFFSTLIIGLLFIKLFPNFTKETAQAVTQEPFKSLGVGLLTVIVAPVLAVLLLITVVGIPLAIITIFGYILVLYIAKIFVAFAIGKALLKSKNTYLAFFLGLIVYSLFRIIPVVGFVLALITAVAGTGAYISTKVSIYKKLREKKLV